MNKFSQIIIALIFILITGINSSAQTVIAKVGNRVITLEELKLIMASTPYGLPKEEYRSFDENNLMFKLLVEVIDSELLYQEAIILNIPKSDEFIRLSTNYSESVLADIYRQNFLENNLKLNDATVEAFAAKNKLTKDAARALMQKNIRKELLNGESSRLFDLYAVHFSTIIASKEISQLTEKDILVESILFKISFGDIRDGFRNFGSTKQDLFDYLSQVVEVKLFCIAAQTKKMDKTDHFKEIAGEYNRNLAINIFRKRLKEQESPTKEEIEGYISKNEYLKYYPHKVATLMIVVETEDEARKIRKMAIEGNNFYELAMEYSIGPNAKINGGDIGPVTIGENPYTALDAIFLSLNPGEISQPVKGEKGFSIFKMLEKMEQKERPESEQELVAVEKITEQRILSRIEKLRKAERVVIYKIEI